ncbi:YesL family protein [Fredinandcohnia salidurans]|uniref:YesL family protein n=1 Tax=Fredinandcohnia salidurans TaxID=2595041 RepID=A0ABW4MP93_9BACI|nr:YesL family protein [Fredinandcohnia onubensis]
MLGGLDSPFYRWCGAISRLIYLNMLWLLFTIMGLVVVGFVPATVALFAVTRKWIMGDEDIPVFSTFWSVYKKEFLKSNLLGLTLIIAGYILYVDLVFLPTTSLFFIVVRYALIAICSVYIVILLYIFPIYVHFNGNIKSYLKNAVMYGLSYPLVTFAMVLGIILLYIGFTYVPSLIPFLSVSILAYFIMWLALKVFARIEEKVNGKDEVKSNEREPSFSK